MSTWGDRLGKLARMAVGVGESLAPDDVPEPQSVNHNEWKEGLVSFEADEDIPPGAAQLLQDVESTLVDALMRAPGILELEDVDPRDLSWLFEHAAVDFATALIAIDPPYIGVKTSGNFTFTDKSIAATGSAGWNVVNVAGTLLFSNGTSATYLRDWTTGDITDISAEVIAQTFANQFGRTFAGAYTDPISGYLALGVRWNASSAEPDDWSGLGSGAQLLISNAPEADRVVAMRPIGFDALAILCRRTLWLGYPTGNADEPADLRVRFPNVGCVSERTAVATPEGVIFLADDGVRSFTINETKVISTQINNLLLPIDYLNLSSYYAIFNPNFGGKYQLYTPEGVWIYHLPTAIRPGRWYFRNYIGSSAAMFTAQNSNLFWNTVVGTWAQQLLTWNEMLIGETNAPTLVFNGQASKIGVEDYGTEAYFDDAQDAYWISRQDAAKSTDVFITQGVEIQYQSGASGVVTFTALDEDGDEVGATAITLPSSSNKKINRMVWFTIAGTGTTIKMKLTSGTPEIFSIKHTFDGASPTLQAL